jgi:hypothetical protein
MKLVTVLSVFALPTFALATAVRYDETYDNASASLDTVACSDGQNGLITKGYSTFGSLPKFPYIGSSDAVEGWNSKNCGTCWNVSYTSGGKTMSINILAIDHADKGFVLSKTAMNSLTGNLAVDLGTAEAEVQQVASSVCGVN